VTAVARHRTRSTVLALVVSIVAIVAMVVIGIAGVHTLADSTLGRRAEGQALAAPGQRLPFTATALVGVIDDAGRLTSSVAIALEPNGVGGNIVAIAASADAGSGTTGELAPLDAVLEVSGPTAYREAVERLTGLSFDVVEVVDEVRFAQLVTPLGDLLASFPVPLHDASSGQTWEAGEVTLGPTTAAMALTASDPAVADWYLEPARAAVWKAVAQRVGGGIGSALPVPTDQDLPALTDLDAFVDRLFAAPVAFRALGFTIIDPQRVAEELPKDLRDAFGPGAVEGVVAHDRAELLMVFGAIAPARLGAPLEAPSFRVVSGFTDDALATLGFNRSDVLKRAIDGLLFVKVNIVSVADLPGSTVPDVTRIEVADPSVVGGVQETYGSLFGEIDVVVAKTTITGVDIEVTLGRSFLDQLRGESPADVAGSG
jgi:hypothetical protein